MKKLKLDVNALAVESFETVATPGPVGTVIGQEADSIEICIATLAVCVPLTATLSWWILECPAQPAPGPGSGGGGGGGW